MEMKLMIIVILCEFCFSADLNKKKPLSESLDVFKRCGGWGKEIKNMKDYISVKEQCYLTFRHNVLCCIEKPDCPEDLVAETPLVPNLLYNIEKLELGCVEKAKNVYSTTYFCEKKMPKEIADLVIGKFKKGCDERTNADEPVGEEPKIDKKKTMT